MKPRSINIFLLDGDPNGIRVAQISMSTIQAIAFRRNQLRRVREAFPEIERPGVYVLIGADENEPDRQFAYIGESEGVGARLSYHNSNEVGRDAKGFWTDTVVLISKDENLTKSHARYVESCLIRSVGGNPRWTIPNTKRPSDDAGKLPLPDRAAMDEFVDQTKTLVGALGWDLFREMRGRAPEAAPTGRDLSQSPPIESPRFYFRGGLRGRDGGRTVRRLCSEFRVKGSGTDDDYHPKGHDRTEEDTARQGGAAPGGRIPRLHQRLQLLIGLGRCCNRNRSERKWTDSVEVARWSDVRRLGGEPGSVASRSRRSSWRKRRVSASILDVGFRGRAPSEGNINCDDKAGVF